MALVLLMTAQAMKKISNMKRTVVALGLLTILGGCQGTYISRPPVSLDNAGFMIAWNSYRHCQADTNLDTMRADMQHLLRTAAMQEASSSFSLPLPAVVSRVVEKPAQRLAADPTAMAAACALSTGRAALRAERLELADEMFRAVLKNHPQPEYAYYADQARIGLNQVERAIQFAGHPGSAPAVVTVSVASSASRDNASAFLED
jgi:hypothetical protein